MKPRVSICRLTEDLAIWLCSDQIFHGLGGFGYGMTPMAAYENWKRLCKK